MLQDWSNFMSPSGGSMENSLEFGTSSLLVDIGASLSVRYLFEPLRKRDRGTALQQYNTLKGRISGREYVRTDLGGLKADIKNRNKLDGRLRARYKEKLSGINSKYSKLKFGARAIGWGYVALAAASIVESATTPGLTMAAEMNNAQTMGMSTPLDSSQAYTQRQRAMMAIHDSQLGIRNVIGSEAGYLHR